MKQAAHIVRLAVVLIVIGVLFLVVRTVMVPENFGIHGGYTYGYFRAESEQEQASGVPVYRGSEKCKECHDPQYAIWSSGRHSSVGCETCHGNWKAHNSNRKEAVIKDTSVQACMVCHAKIAGRPEGFPQIDSISQHVNDKGGQYQEGQSCSVCHNPHSPT